MLKNISNLPISELIFHDYALPDNIVFYEMNNIKVTSDLINSAKAYKYMEIFLLEPLPYCHDGIRAEDEFYQKRFNKNLKKNL